MEIMKKHLLYEKKSNYTKNLTLIRTCYFCKNTDSVMELTLEACLAHFLKCFLKITDKFLASICNFIGDALNEKRRCSSNWRLIPLQILP